MEKSQTDFVQECLAEIAALKERIAALEEKLENYPADEPQEATPVMEEEPEDAPVDFTDLDLEADVPLEDAREANRRSSERPAGPGILPAGKIVEGEKAAGDSGGQSPLKLDETASLPWRKDKPGLKVKNIRSGISLYDRALFIGTLFKEDFSLYENTIRDLNEFVSLDQAVGYIRTHFPEWNLHSDVVYNFMMSIRKKLG